FIWCPKRRRKVREARCGTGGSRSSKRWQQRTADRSVVAPSSQITCPSSSAPIHPRQPAYFALRHCASTGRGAAHTLPSLSTRSCLLATAGTVSQELIQRSLEKGYPRREVPCVSVFVTTTVPVRHYSRPDQAAILRAHCQEEDLGTLNVLVQALDSDVLPDG